jgi:hypothetical protein
MDLISQTMLLGAAGAGKDTYWFSKLTGTSFRFNGICLDAARNVYVTGIPTLVKYSNQGVLQFQKNLGTVGLGTLRGFGVAADASGDVFVAGNQDVFLNQLVKYNSSGTVLWQRFFDAAGVEQSFGAAVDTSGNFYAAGVVNSNFTVSKFYTFDFNSSIWNRSVDVGVTEKAFAVAVDADSNVYATGEYDVAGTASVLTVKFNSSGTVLWIKPLSSPGTNVRGYGIAVDPSGNVYITGARGDGSNVQIGVFVAKYNTSGVLQWQRTLSGTYSNQGQAIAVDASGNCYITGAGINASVVRNIIIAKYDTSGTLLFQRQLTTGDARPEGYGITLDSRGNMYVAGISDTINDAVVAKLPGDGTLTGTYGSYSYVAGSLTAATGSMTDQTGTGTTSVPSLPMTATTRTAADATGTSATITI